MSVIDKNVIDFASIRPATGEAVLTISDHLEFGDENRLEALQAKINSYLAFVESGEIFQEYPSAKDRAIAIEIALKHAPDEQGLRFVNG